MTHELLSRLFDQTLAHLSSEEKLSFLERLFQQLPAKAQQEFLLELAARITNPQLRRSAGPGRWSRPHHRPGPPPWAFCLQLMHEYESSSDPTVHPAKLFAALADENRLKIVKLLATSAKTVDELVKMLDLSQSTVSHHLRILKEAGVLTMEKQGRNSVYALNSEFNVQDEDYSSEVNSAEI